MLKKNWRISLTEKCNLKCFFCHEEGLDMKKKRKSPDFQLLYLNIKKALNLDLTDDITFTGGEPLIKKNEILKILSNLNEDNLTPKITIGTNGLLIDEEFLKELSKYNGKIKFNMSLHAIDEKTYDKITCSQNNFHKIPTILNLIKTYGFELKTNVVLLKGLNDSADYLNRLLDFALKHKVDTVKFLELLITEPLAKYHKFYLRVESVFNQFGKKKFIKIRDDVDRSVYAFKDTNLTVELQVCPCRRGCSMCYKSTGRVLTANNEIAPCFVQSNLKLRFNPDTILSVFDKSDKVVKSYAKKYKANSPLIVGEGFCLQLKKEFFHLIMGENNVLKVLDIFKNNFPDYKLDQKMFFTEFHYLKKETNFIDFSKYDKIVKVVRYDDNLFLYREVISNLFFSKESDGRFYIQTDYVTKNAQKEVTDLTDFDSYFDFFGYKQSFSIKRERYIYKNQTNEIAFEKVNDKIFIKTINENRLDEGLFAFFSLKNIKKHYLSEVSIKL